MDVMMTIGDHLTELFEEDKFMRSLRKGEFYVIYLFDDEKRTFNVIGPAYEDDNIDNRTHKLIQKGRKIHICVSQPQKNSRGFHPENYIKRIQFGYIYDPRVRW